MFGDGPLTLREFAIKEPLPLARIHDSVLEFMRHRDDAVLFGAQAVNAYVEEPRMTQNVDIMSTRASELAEEIRTHLSKQFTIAVRVREVSSGRGFRIFQLREPKNRHLVDIRQTEQLPPNQWVADVRVATPEELIAQKVIAYAGRRGQPKSGTDWRDLTLLLLAYPTLKTDADPVFDRLTANGADSAALAEWQRLVALQITAEDADSDF